jgi:site-specific DNA-methyltransferase (adenine-specific)/modification methylase
VLCGDSTKQEDVERLMDGKKADMVFTDPPYGIDLLKDGQSLGKSKAYSAVKGDDVPYDPSHLFQWSKEIFVWGANHYAHRLPASSCWIVWDKQGGAKHNTFADCELAWCNKKMPARCITHIWDGFRRGRKSPSDTKASTAFN